MNYIFNILSYPFKQYPLILLFIWVITTATDTIPYYETRNYIYCIHIAMDSFFFSYLIVLFTSFIKKNIIKKLFLNTFVFLYLIYNIINLYCIYILKHASIVNVASIIANSNSKEIQEFISHTISPINLLFCIIFFFIFICLLKIIYKAPIYPSHNNIYIGFLLLAISFITIASKPLILSEISYGKIILSIKTINETPPNFSTTLTNTQIEETHQYHPKNIVIIIGESFSKYHSSLYRYNKGTNPLLEKEETLYVYQNVTSPATHTIDAFKAIMSVYSPYRHSEDMWYKMPTIPEIFNIAGYQTIWISNQDRKGFYDNIPSKYAELCHKNFFLKEENPSSYDEEIVKKIEQEFSSNTNQRNIFFLHLMGQHVNFSSRYPSEFNNFAPQEYIEYPAHQRVNLAHYDNATLYNDYVIHKIIQHFNSKETILLYFSDHSIDIYDTDKDYCGHANSTLQSQNIGKQIPFMIYVSPLLEKKVPSLIQRIKGTIDTEFSTDDIIYTLMDIAGFKFKDNNDVENYSIFKHLCKSDY